MADKTFSEADILRLIANNLTQIERDTVICTILFATGHASGRVSNKTIFQAIKQLLSGFLGSVGLAVEIVVAIAGEGKYSPDF